MHLTRKSAVSVSRSSALETHPYAKYTRVSWSPGAQTRMLQTTLKMGPLLTNTSKRAALPHRGCYLIN